MNPASTSPGYRLLILVLTVLLPGIAVAQERDMQHMDLSAAVRNVHFDNSCSPNVQAVIDQGVATLYSFWFPEARKLFETAAQRDPECSVAYWGQASVVSHK